MPDTHHQRCNSPYSLVDATRLFHPSRRHACDSHRVHQPCTACLQQPAYREDANSTVGPFECDAARPHCCRRVKQGITTSGASGSFDAREWGGGRLPRGASTFGRGLASSSPPTWRRRAKTSCVLGRGVNACTLLADTTRALACIHRAADYDC
jgi:hypothetical protein